MLGRVELGGHKAETPGPVLEAPKEEERNCLAPGAQGAGTSSGMTGARLPLPGEPVAWLARASCPAEGIWESARAAMSL